MDSVRCARVPVIRRPGVHVHVESGEGDVNLAIGATCHCTPICLVAAVGATWNADAEAEDIDPLAIRCLGPDMDAKSFVLGTLVAVKHDEGQVVRLLQDPRLKDQVGSVERVVDVAHFVVGEDDHAAFGNLQDSVVLGLILGDECQLAPTGLDDQEHAERFPLDEVDVGVHQTVLDIIFSQLLSLILPLLRAVLVRHANHCAGTTVGHEAKGAVCYGQHELGERRKVEVATVQGVAHLLLCFSQFFKPCGLALVLATQVGRLELLLHPLVLHVIGLLQGILTSLLAHGHLDYAVPLLHNGLHCSNGKVSRGLLTRTGPGQIKAALLGHVWSVLLEVVPRDCERHGVESLDDALARRVDVYHLAPFAVRPVGCEL
mmetsp:Transcript_69044/g.156497  ORF Transcript_69044/g.156497 Transcript_69044/m.156497 type:complete len:374 (-) Transcript_69044:152-1273(-)